MMPRSSEVQNADLFALRAADTDVACAHESRHELHRKEAADVVVKFSIACSEARVLLSSVSVLAAASLIHPLPCPA